jgi:hypothetical protein
MPESLDLKGGYQYFPLPHFYAKIDLLAGISLTPRNNAMGMMK